MNAPLYKRSSNGKIESWQIFVDGDGFYTVSGQFTGKLTRSATTTCLPKNVGKKNETTAEQQAELEAKAKYDKKLKDGYVIDLSQVDEVTKLVPQLAKVYGDYKDKVKFPVISSEKMDGTRLLASKNGLFTRNGEKYVSIPHIYEALKPVFEQYPDLVLDGEAFNLELKDNFNKIISLVKKKKPTAEELAESKELIKFYIFDMFFVAGNCTLDTFSRKAFVSKVANELNCSSIVALPFKVCNSVEELDAAYAEYLANGQEGQMINSYSAVYENKRTINLLKRKEFQDAEFTITNITEGKGERAGCAKLVLQTPEGKSFESSITGTIEYMKEIFDNRQSYIGKQATIKFQNFTPDGIPRFPVCTAIRDYE